MKSLLFYLNYTLPLKKTTLAAESLAAPKIGAMLRIRSKEMGKVLRICSEFAILSKIQRVLPCRKIGAYIFA